MQLPRGTFHSIKKHVTFRSLFDETAALQFTGSVVVSFPEGVSFLVLEAGRTVLADYKGLCGKEAFRYLEKMSEVNVDAELSTLNDTQLALAKEFNKPCEIKLESGSSSFFGKIEMPQKNATQSARTPAGPGSLFTRAPRQTFDKGEVEDLLHGDLETLDRMDITKMSGKFRTNAESIARELKLDHLVND
jgi:hypothetical protein